MAKWIFALLVIVSAATEARELPPPTNGCAVLNDIVYQEVTASRWGMTGADLAHTGMLEPGIMVCTSTTQAVSKAFADAMRVVGGDVEWHGDFDVSVDTCLSGFIEQCQPRGRELSQTVWQAVSKTVIRAMPDGTAADRSIFSVESMRLAMRAALRANNVAVGVR